MSNDSLKKKKKISKNASKSECKQSKDICTNLPEFEL